MTEQTPPTTEAEAKARLEIAKAELDALVPEARALVAKRIAEAKARIAHARAHQATWEQAQASLAPHRAHPEGAVHARRADHMVGMYAAMGQMMAIELAAQEATGQALAVEGVPAWGAFQDAQTDVRFHEQRRRMVAHLLGFLWSMNEAGARVVQEAAGPGAGDGPAEAVRAAMGADLNVERLVLGLSAELVEAEQAAAWAQAAFDGYEKLAPDARRALLKDARWGEVEGAVALLDKLHGRLGGNPALTRLFPKPERVELPYGPPAEAKLPGRVQPPAAPPRGHDQVTLRKGRATSFKLGDPPPGKR